MQQQAIADTLNTSFGHVSTEDDALLRMKVKPEQKPLAEHAADILRQDEIFQTDIIEIYGQNDRTCARIALKDETGAIRLFEELQEELVAALQKARNQTCIISLLSSNEPTEHSFRDIILTPDELTGPGFEEELAMALQS